MAFVIPPSGLWLRGRPPVASWVRLGVEFTTPCGDELMRRKPLLRRTNVEPETDCGRLSSRAHLGLTGARRAHLHHRNTPRKRGSSAHSCR